MPDGQCIMTMICLALCAISCCLNLAILLVLMKLYSKENSLLLSKIIEKL